jgi:hypothetical protein
LEKRFEKIENRQAAKNQEGLFLCGNLLLDLTPSADFETAAHPA